MKKDLITLAQLLILAAAFGWGAYSLEALGPSSAAPAGNVPTPVTQLGQSQVKEGGLALDALAVGDSAITIMTSDGRVGIGTIKMPDGPHLFVGGTAEAMFGASASGNNTICADADGTLTRC